MILDGSELARQADLPELVGFPAGTGCRIGEALALTWPNVDLERHLINIDTTLIRVTGQGLLIKRPKTKSSIRMLRVPLWLVAILRDSRRAIRSHRVRCSQTWLAGIVTRTMSSVTTVKFGAGRRLSGWCRTPTGRRLQPCLTGRVSVPGPSLTSSAMRESR
jgi:integrase